MIFSNFNIYSKSLSVLDFTKIKVINTINPHSYCLAKSDKKFNQALTKSDILLPDGFGIVLAERIINGNSIKKIAGYDLFIFLMQKLNSEFGSVFFLGSTNETLEKIKMKCNKEYPNIKIGSLSPSFKENFSYKESLNMCKKVNQFKPDILFVGMTAPKQEKWVYDNLDLLDINLICSVGAVFDFYAGNIKRSSNFWINLNLEWFPRLIQEPRRLFYRNFISTPKFILEILSFKFFGRGIL